MAKGTRSKGGGTTATNKDGTIKSSSAATAVNLESSQNHAKAGTGRQNKNNKQKSLIQPQQQQLQEEEIPKKTLEETSDSHSANTATGTTGSKGKESQPKQQPQPTSEQLMIAQIIGGDHTSEDPGQRQKIHQVMDITGKAEDAVATALFDAGWDESRAIELLLEDGDQLTGWEETGKKGKKKQQKAASEEAHKDEWEDDNFGHENKDKSRQRGTVRSRRGGGGTSQSDKSQGRNRGGGGGGDGGGGSVHFGLNGEQQPSKGGRGAEGPRRGLGRGGSSSGGGRSGQGRGRRGGSSVGAGGGGPGREGGYGGGGETSVGGFSGSIDTWNPVGHSPADTSSGGGAGSGGGGSSGGGSTAPARGGSSSHKSRGGPLSKDAFDNAGNWGDDFPATDDWDNEEYTGSLADTKVFTPSSSNPPSQAPPGSRANKRLPPGEGYSQKQKAPSQQPTAGQSRTYVNGPPPTSAPQQQQQQQSSVQIPPPSSTQQQAYSQSIDLSTLLQKPTTQSSIGTQPQHSLLQFNQQLTADPLKAGGGISGQPAASKGGDISNGYYGGGSSSVSSGGVVASNRVPPTNSSVSYGQPSAFTSIKPQQQQQQKQQQQQQQQQPQTQPPPASTARQSKTSAAPGGEVSSGMAGHRSRVQQPSKIPNSAVEMPGDSLARLDVQFGGLDLQFGGAGGVMGTNIGTEGFEFVSSGPAAVGTQNSSVKDDSRYMTAGMGGDKDKQKAAVVAAGGVASSADGGQPRTAAAAAAAAAAGSATVPPTIDSYRSHHSAAPSAKEVNKTLSNAMSSANAGGGNKAVAGSDGYSGEASKKSVSSYGRGPPPPSETNVDISQGSSSTVDPGGYRGSGSGGAVAGGGYGSYNPKMYGGSNQGSSLYNQHHQYGTNSGYHPGAAVYNSVQQQNQSAVNYKAAHGSGSGGIGGQYQNDAGGKGFDSTSLTGVHHGSHNQSLSNAAAVLGLTSTTNALSGKISATSASKVSVPNLPPGVASMLPHQYMTGLQAAAFYGLQQPSAAAMYSAAYGNTGLEDLAALQRSAGLHTLQTGYYDPSSQYAATSLATAGGGGGGGGGGSSRNDGTTSSLGLNLVSGSGAGQNSSSLSNNAGSGSASDKSAFGNVASVANAVTSSSSSAGGGPSSAQHNAANQAAAGLNFAASNAFAAQQAGLPPGYAYFYGQVPSLQAAYGATAAGVYPATPMGVPTATGGTATTQFQKSAYGTSYGSGGYDQLGQQGGKDYGNSYSGNGTSGKSSGAGGSSGQGAGAAHQYWGNSSALTSTQLW